MSRARDRADGKITGNVIPASHEAFSLGSAGARFNDGFFSASTVDIGGLAISKDANGDAEFKDGSGAFKKIMASEIHLGTGASKAVMKRQTDGSVGFATTDNSGTATTAEVGGSTSVYTNTSSLPSIASATSGDMAFVTSNKRFYIFNGTAWYSVVLTNTAPTVTGASLTYTLAENGAATVVTLSSSDPEGDPLTFSHTATGLGTEATITQGTGSNTNVFTVTPSSNAAHAGVFSVVFSATDGANVVNNSSSFTLEFAVPQHFSTTLKVKTSGNNARTNSAFDDASTGNHTVTANGNAYQTSLRPFSYNWSNKFDGTGDYISSATSSDYTIGTGDDWTVECWFYATAHTGGIYHSHTSALPSSTQGHALGITSASKLILYQNGSYQEVSSPAISLNQWYHVAISRASGSKKVFLNGALVKTISETNAYTGTYMTVGGHYSTSYLMNGYISDFHYIKGTAKYTTAFAASYEKLTAHSNTKLLTCRSNRFMDESTSSHAITMNGNATISTVNPLEITDKWGSSDGGSGYFDGSGDYLTIADSADFDLATAWTFETWVYPTNLGSGFNPIYQTGVDSSNGFVIDMSSNGSTPKLSYYAGSWVTLSSSATIPNNSWSHIAVTWDGSYYKIFVNGVQTGSATSSTAITNPTTGVQVGRSTTSGGAQRYYTGYLSDTHFVKGTAKYTSAFTPPTVLTALDSNTKLKLNFAQAGMFDLVGENSLKLYGNIQESTTQTKYATTSIKFDGAGDYIIIDNVEAPRTGDFQIEGWWYQTNTGDSGMFKAFSPLSNNTSGVAIGTTGTSFWVTDNGQTNLGTHWSQNAWHHVAVVRRNGKQYTFVDGVNKDTATGRANTDDYSTNGITIGGWYGLSNLMAGFIEDFRYLKGHTTYPNERPQEALTAVSGTSLQFANASTIPSSPNGLTVTASEGSPTVSTFTPPDSNVSHSIYYDGNDINSVAANTNIHLGTGDFTIEGYFYMVSHVSTYGALFGTRVANNTSGFGLGYAYFGNMYIYSGGYIIQNIPFELKKWMHLVYQRKTISGTSTHQIFRDGIFVGSGTTARDYANQPLTIGGDLATTENAHAYIADFRVIKGTAIYDTSFTPPSASL